FSSRRRHTRFSRDWSSDVCSSDLQFDFFRGHRVIFWNGRHIWQRGKQPLSDLLTRLAFLCVHDRDGQHKPDTQNDQNNERVFFRSEERRVGKEWTTSREPTEEHKM